MIHTYLLQPGTWRARGRSFDSRGKASPVEGESAIEHKEAVWLLHGEMRIRGRKQAAFSVEYRFRPLRKEDVLTTWEADNSSLGKLKGTISVLDDTLASYFTSVDGQFEGDELLTKLNDDTYKSKGKLMKDGAIVSSWSVELKRVQR